MHFGLTRGRQAPPKASRSSFPTRRATGATTGPTPCPALPPISAIFSPNGRCSSASVPRPPRASPRSSCNFPTTSAPSAVKAELDRLGLTQLGVNTPQCPEFGLAALPGRERDFEAAFTRALDYVVAIGGRAMHCMAGAVPAEQRPAAERVFIANLSRAAAAAGQVEHHAPDRADQSARPAELFSQPCRACRRSRRQDRRAECARPVRFLSCPDRRRRPHQALREISAGDRPRPDRGGAEPARARRRRGQLSGGVRRG